MTIRILHSIGIYIKTFKVCHLMMQSSLFDLASSKLYVEFTQRVNLSHCLQVIALIMVNGGIDN